MHPEHVGNELLRSWSIDFDDRRSRDSSSQRSQFLIRAADVRYRTDRLNMAG
jgi:hypothetical protein